MMHRCRRRFRHAERARVDRRFGARAGWARAWRSTRCTGRRRSRPRHAEPRRPDERAGARPSRRAIDGGRRRRPGRRGHRARHHRVERHPGRRGPRAARRLLPLVRPPRLGGGGARSPRVAARDRASRPSTGAAASTRPSGASRSCCTGCATTPTSAAGSSPRSSTATWWRRCCAASPTPAQVPRSVCAMGHKWMWNAALGGLPPEEFPDRGGSAARRRARQDRGPLRDLRHARRPPRAGVGRPDWGCAPAFRSRSAPSTRTGTPSAPASASATWST